jgi:hypothetical protein
MSLKNMKEVSPFIEAALKLDDDFQELERLAANLERAEIDSDAGLERGRDLLGKFGECSSRIGSEIQALATSLEDSRSRAEKAAESAANRAVLIQERLTRANTLSVGSSETWKIYCLLIFSSAEFFPASFYYV